MSLTHRELKIERDLAVDQPSPEMLTVVDKALARVAELERYVERVDAQSVPLKNFYEDHRDEAFGVDRVRELEVERDDAVENLRDALAKWSTEHKRVAEIEGELAEEKKLHLELHAAACETEEERAKLEAQLHGSGLAIAKLQAAHRSRPMSEAPRDGVYILIEMGAGYKPEVRFEVLNCVNGYWGTISGGVTRNENGMVGWHSLPSAPE